jgi:hypothetical protein
LWISKHFLNILLKSLKHTTYPKQIGLNSKKCCQWRGCVILKIGQICIIWSC